MAAITFTPASVEPAGRNNRRRRVAGEAIIQGGLYYIKASDRRAYNAQCDGASAAEADWRGVAETAATAAGDEFIGTESGDLDVGAVLVMNKPYCVSRTAGKVIAHDELVTPDLVVLVGFPVSTSRLRLAKCNTGYTIPA
jgi:hypothetical protein